MEAINWEAVQAVAEVLGLVVVVGSLIFVGFQIRQSANATRAATMNNIMGSWGDVYVRFGENDNLSTVLWNCVQDPKSQSDIDQWRFSMVFTGFLHYLHNAYYQWTINAYESKAWSAQTKFMINLMSLPGPRAVWHERKGMFPLDFQTYIDTEVLTKPPDPDYKRPGG